MKITRASPQHWTFQGDQNIRDVFQGILCGKIAMNDKKFESVWDNFFFHQFQSNDLFSGPPQLPEKPHIDTPDYISGTEVYIRSKCMPNKYWYMNGSNDEVELSEDERTKSCIEYAKSPSDRETLLINDDDVVISAVYGDDTINIDMDDGRLVASYGSQANFKFRALLHGGFDIDTEFYDGYLLLAYNEARCTYGEWELV